MSQTLQSVFSGEAEEAGSSMFMIRKDLDNQDQQQAFIERKQFIGLRLANEEFLIDVPHIHEIIMLPTITYVPLGPAFIEGVINLRGNIVPAINLRKLMHMSRGQVTLASRIIILKHLENTIGLIVDSISSVVSVVEADIEMQTFSVKNSASEVITRYCKVNDRVVGIIDLNKIIGIVKPSLGTDDHAA